MQAYEFYMTTLCNFYMYYTIKTTIALLAYLFILFFHLFQLSLDLGENPRDGTEFAVLGHIR